MQAQGTACILKHSGTFFMNSETFCKHSGTFCIYSGTFWNIQKDFACILERSGTFRNILHAFWNILEHSKTFCMHSGMFCMFSGTFRNVLHAFIAGIAEQKYFHWPQPQYFPNWREVRTSWQCAERNWQLPEYYICCIFNRPVSGTSSRLWTTLDCQLFHKTWLNPICALLNLLINR